MKAKILKMRFPKKVMFILSGVLLLGGASGAFALYAAKSTGHAETEEQATLSGQACTTVQTLKLRRNGQRWIRKYVNTESIGGIDRVRTALRITGVLAKQEKADFYQVIILDHAGPKDRAHMRGAAIGAEVLFAPKPDQIPGMAAPFVAKYNDADANMAGLFHGKEIVMPLDAIKATLTAMDDKSDCIDTTVEIGEPGSEAKHKSMPGDEEVVAGHEPAGEHGEAAEAGHGEAPAEGAHAELPGETETGGGMFASIKAMIFGADEAPAQVHGESPAEHDAAAPAETGDHAAADPEAEGGMFASLKGMVFGSETGVQSPVPDHAVATPAENGDPAKIEEHEAPAVGHDAAVPAEAEEHAAAEEAAAH